MLYRALHFFLAVGSVQALQYGYNQDPLRKDNDLVAAAFPNVEGIELLSPGFTSELQPGFANVTQGPTDAATIDAFLQSLSRNNRSIHYRKAGFESEEGRYFPYVEISSNCGRPKKDKIRVWIQGGVHGDEPGGDESALALLGKLDADHEWTSALLQNLVITIFPRYNPDGQHYFQRQLASNYDPNRDHIQLERQQTRDIKSLYNDFDPHISVDLHEFSAFRQYGVYLHASDGLIAAAKNPNIHPDIRNLSENLFLQNMGEAMERKGLRWEPYMTSERPTNTTPGYEIQFAEAGADARIGRNAMGLTQSISFLIEMRGVGLGDQHWQRRVASGVVMLSDLLQTASDHADEVRSTVNNAIEEFKNSDEDITVTYSSELVDRNFTMIDVTDGSISQVPIKWRPATNLQANLTRPRPEGYYIPRPWSSVAERLRDSGVEVKTLRRGWAGTVESFGITSIMFEDEYYEGDVLATVTTNSTTRYIELPPGSFYVSTRQKNAALAMMALEPESADSYVSSNVIAVNEGDEYPIFRTVSSKAGLSR